MTWPGNGPSPVPARPVVLVTSPRSRRAARGLPQARAALRELGVELAAELPVDQASRLPELVERGDGAPPLVDAGEALRVVTPPDFEDADDD